MRITEAMLLSSRFASAPLLLAYMRNSEDIVALGWLIQFHKENGLFTVVEWKHSEDGNWALHVDMDCLGKPGQQMLIPIAWLGSNKPTVAEAIDVFRNTKVLYGQEKKTVLCKGSVV